MQRLQPNFTIDGIRNFMATETTQTTRFSR